MKSRFGHGVCTVQVSSQAPLQGVCAPCLGQQRVVEGILDALIHDSAHQLRSRPENNVHRGIGPVVRQLEDALIPLAYQLGNLDYFRALLNRSFAFPDFDFLNGRLVRIGGPPLCHRLHRRLYLDCCQFFFCAQ
jgi:hypothetical protein